MNAQELPVNKIRRASSVLSLATHSSRLALIEWSGAHSAAAAGKRQQHKDEEM